jgi:putative transposase
VDTALGRRFYLLFFLDIPKRRVTLAGINSNPTGPLTTQAARNLFLTRGEAFNGCKLLVRDRAGQFTASFDDVFTTEGNRVAKTPARTPVANCYIERWIGTLRRELLDLTIIFDQHQLHRLVTGYIAQDNRHRPHRALQQQPPSPLPTANALSPSPTANAIRFPGTTV